MKEERLTPAAGLFNFLRSQEVKCVLFSGVLSLALDSDFIVFCAIGRVHKLQGKDSEVSTGQTPASGLSKPMQYVQPGCYQAE